VDRLAWVATTRADQLERCQWILGPRDRVVWKLTGEVATDPTMASLTGCYGPDGTVVEEVARLVGQRLPVVMPSETVMGTVPPDVAAGLGLPADVPVVIGAGDRQCEVLGTDASASRPMVSWGTTANVSMPVGPTPVAPPPGVVSSRAVGGWQLEGGTSAAGSLLSWLSDLCGRSPSELSELAASSPPGARGVTAVAWLSGARSPWWRPGARAGFVGLSAGHGPGDLARAVFEAVARDVQRCLFRMDARQPAGPLVTELGLAGGAADTPVCIEVLTGITGLPVRLRRSGQSASAGAALLGARAVGSPWAIDTVDPVVQQHAVDPAIARIYADLATHDNSVAGTLVELEAAPPCR
jgi:xylulokinase